MDLDVTLRIEFPAEPGVRLTRTGATEVVRPVGDEIAESAISPVNPKLVSVIVVVVDLPAKSVTDFEVEDIVKSGSTGTSSVVLWTSEP